jgi:hypothetical protein
LSLVLSLVLILVLFLLIVTRRLRRLPCFFDLSLGFQGYIQLCASERFTRP